MRGRPKPTATPPPVKPSTPNPGALPPKVPIPKARPPGPRSKPLRDLEAGDCRFPVGADLPAGDRLLCGDPRAGAGPYCAPHEELAGGKRITDRERETTERLVRHLDRRNR